MHFTLSDALARGHGTERSFLCPVHEDSRPSASLNVIKQVWYCYTCGAHGSLTGEDALIEPDYNQLKRWLSDKLEENRVYPEAWLARWTAGPVHPYWLGRVGSAAAAHFKLGFDPERNAGTYPLRDEGNAVLGVVRRSLDRSDDGPRYHYPRGVDVGRLLFNYSPRARRDVVLVEGALDAIALWNAGVDAFAIYGSKLSPEQVRLIDRVDPDRIYTCYDNDDAGYKAYKMTEDAFRHRLVSRVTWPASWGKDVDEIGLKHVRQVVPEHLQSDLACVRSSSWNSKTPSTTTSTPRRMRIVRAPS